VADRWHLWHNLADAVERTVARHRAGLAAAVDTEDHPGHDDRHDDGGRDAAASSGPAPTRALDNGVGAPGRAAAAPAETAELVAERTDRIAIRTRERYAAVHAQLEDGQSIRAITDRLAISRGTVRRFARAATAEELLVNNGTGRRRSLLEEFKPYLHQRWNSGCTNSARLFDEITDRGYTGGPQILRKYLRTLRATGSDQETGTPLKPPSVRRVTAWIMSDPANLEPGTQRRLEAVLAASPALAAIAGHVRAFAVMMCQLRGTQLESWIAAVTSDDLPALHSFVTGLRRDHDAGTAGLTLPWNSGPAEGHVNRIKMIKRQMFGRAKHDLLRKRVLLAD
jgi:transposase